MKGIDPEVAVQKLNIKPNTKPIKQNRRHFEEQHNEIIEKELEKLLKIGDIEKFQFPRWSVNVVLVPEQGNKWRMCFDFWDLNKGLPKRSLSLTANRSTLGFNSRVRLVKYDGCVSRISLNPTSPREHA